MEDVEIIRSARKTVAIEITRDGRVLVRAPYRTSMRDIERMVAAKAEWIRRHLEKMRDRKAQKGERLSEDEIRALAKAALEDIPKRLEKFAPLVGVTYGRVTIRNQRTRWGSCSAKGNLNFNCLLMLCPEAVRDYVVVHELCHRKEMNHSAKFWALVRQTMPDYEIRRKWLRSEGNTMIGRLPE